MSKYRAYIIKQDNNENVGVLDADLAPHQDARAHFESQLGEGEGIDQIVGLAEDRTPADLMEEITSLRDQLRVRGV